MQCTEFKRICCGRAPISHFRKRGGGTNFPFSTTLLRASAVACPARWRAQARWRIIHSSWILVQRFVLYHVSVKKKMRIILIVLGSYQASGFRYTMFPRTDTEDAPLTDVGNAPENVPQEIRRQPVFSLPMYKWIRRKDGTSIAVGTSESECESSEARDNATMSPQTYHEDEHVPDVPTSAPSERTEISVCTASCYDKHVANTPSSSIITGVTEIRPGSASATVIGSSVPPYSPTVIASTPTYYSPTSPVCSPGGPAKQPGLNQVMSPTVTIYGDDESASDHDNYDDVHCKSIDVTRLSEIPVPSWHDSDSEPAGRPAGRLGRFAKRHNKLQLKRKIQAAKSATIKHPQMIER